MNQYYKVAKSNGFDFHTGKTINYRENIGKIVKCPNQSEENNLCSDNVLHASKEFLQALSYGELPCSIFKIEGNPVQEQSDKLGFKKFKVIREITSKNFNQAYYKTMIYILNDVKNNYDNEEFIDVTKAIDQTIQVFKNAQKTGKVDESAARSAESAARSAESAARSAESAVRSAWSAARSAESAVRSAWSAESAVRSAWSAARSAKYHEYSEKFIEYLESEN